MAVLHFRSLGLCARLSSKLIAFSDFNRNFRTALGELKDLESLDSTL